MPLASFLRLRRAAAAASTLPVLVEPGELIANTFARQLWIGDVAAATPGVPRALLPICFHSSAVTYQADALVVRNGQIWRAITTVTPHSFNPAEWQQISGAVINTGVYNPTPVKTATYTAAATDLVRVDTRVSTVLVNLPAAPTDGSSVRVLDVGGNFAANPCTVGRNGNLIDHLAANYLLQDLNSATFLFTTGLGWSVMTPI